MYKPPSNKKPVHLVKHLNKIPDGKKIWPCVGDVKYDGVYAYGLMREDDTRIFSRTGMQYLSLKHLENGLMMLRKLLPEDFVLIFEVYNEKYKVNKISGFCRDTRNQHPELHAVVHDVIPYKDFINGLCTIPYIQRRGRVRRLCAQGNMFVESESFHIRNETIADTIFEEMVSRGHEGIIGRDPNGIWIAGKKNELCWKKKIELSYDLLVVDVEIGKPGSKYENTLGKLCCRFREFGKGNGRTVVIKCSGMTDFQRDLWWACKGTESENNIIGRIVKVDGMCFSKNGLIREPRFKEVRYDKVKADF